MSKRAARARVALVGALTLATGAGNAQLGAQSPRRIAPASGQSSGPARGVRQQPSSPTAASHVRISGTVITRDEPPKVVRGATVRARDAAGNIVGTTKTDQAGQFSFALAQAGAYYVELVDDTGRVLAVEDVGEVAISVGPGQNSTTILRVPGKLAAAAWGTTAKTILGAAGAAGIGALVTGGQPASPEQ